LGLIAIILIAVSTLTRHLAHLISTATKLPALSELSGVHPILIISPHHTLHALHTLGLSELSSPNKCSLPGVSANKLPCLRGAR
jgi:hypothetical protein